MSGVHELDYLAVLIASRQRARALGLRGVAEEMGVSASTVMRLLRGSKSPNWPDYRVLSAAAKWVGHTFELKEAP